MKLCYTLSGCFLGYFFDTTDDDAVTDTDTYTDALMLIQTYFLCCFASARKCCMGVLCGNRAAESPG